MLKDGLDSVELSRKEGLQEARDRMQNKTTKKKDTPVDALSSAIIVGEKGEETKESDTAIEGMVDDANHDPPSAEEESLLKEIDIAENALIEACRLQDEVVSDLSDARQLASRSLLCNPFTMDESSKIQQISWLAIAIRKEKSRMGSTGNKRKIVTAVDLLERNDTIVNQDIEALIEGLPGSEFCQSYVFQAFRSGGSGASRTWVHEAQARHEKEPMQLLQLTGRETCSDSPKEKKRKQQQSPQREDGGSNRKKPKVSNFQEKLKVRVDERLARLDIQINDRLRKEAATQREKLVATMVKSLAKEYGRRRKAAEVVAAQTVLEGKVLHAESYQVPHLGPLPAPCAVYNETVVRTWNFLSTFRGFFLGRGYLTEMPSLQALQNAIDSIEDGAGLKCQMDKDEAVSFLTNLAVALCKPLAREGNAGVDDKFSGTEPWLFKKNTEHHSSTTLMPHQTAPRTKSPMVKNSWFPSTI